MNDLTVFDPRGLTFDEALAESGLEAVLDLPWGEPIPREIELAKCLETLDCWLEMMGTTIPGATMVALSSEKFVQLYEAWANGECYFSHQTACLPPGFPGSFPPRFAAILTRLVERYDSDPEFVVRFTSAITHELTKRHLAQAGTSIVKVWTISRAVAPTQDTDHAGEPD